MSKKNRNKNQNTSSVEVEETDVVLDVNNGPSEEAPTDVIAEETATVVEQESTESDKENTVDEQESTTEEISADVDEPIEQPEKVEEVVEQKKEEVVVKPQSNKGILKVEKKSSPMSAVVSIPQTEGVLKFNAIAKSYLDTMKPGRIDDEARRRALVILANMSNHVTMSTDPAVFDTCFRFFMENRSIMLAQSVVISGIEKAIDKAKITKVLQFYTVFQTLVECKLMNNRFNLNITTIRRVLGNDAIANWLIAKRG